MQKISGLSKKHILVTGGAGLIGSAVIKALVENNAKISLLDTNRSHAETIVNALNKEFENVCQLAPETDLTKEASVLSCLNVCEKAFGDIDVLIHAAYPRTDDWHLRLEKIPMASWQENVNQHLNGTFLLTQKLGERMAQRKKGNLVLFSSIYGLVGPNFDIYKDKAMTMPAAYSAIKGGISNFVRYLSSYWGSQGVRVNAICPGGVENGQPIHFIEAYCGQVPMARMAKVDDIVGPTLFLASDLSSYITGVNLPVDGGWTAI